MNVSLLATSDPQLEEMLRACGASVTTITLEGLTALATAARQPDAVVLDLRDRGAIPAALTALKRQHPTTGVLMIMPRLDAAVMLEAMRAGVNECVADPLTRDDLQAALQRVTVHRPAAKTGDVFAVIGAKGGVGATTVAVNVATMLSKLRAASTLLIDLHVSYGDAAVFLGTEPRFSVADAFDNMHRLDATFLRSLVTSTASGVNLLGSSDRPVTGPPDPAHVRSLVSLAADEYPYVVLDVPRTEAYLLDSLDAAGSIVVVANQELATVRSAARMANSLQQRYGSDRVNVVITRYDDGAEIGKDDLERVVGRQVGYVFPNNYPVTISSLNKGRPLVLDNHTKLASAFTSFARSLAGMPAPRQEEKSGLMALLGGRKR